MALNIPLFRPGEAGAIGSQISPMLQALMQQRFRPQELELQKRQMDQAMQIHRDAMAHQQAVDARAAQLFPMQKQMQELQLQALRRQVDPQAQMDYYQQLQQMYGQMQPPVEQPMRPTQPMGEGMGMFPVDAVPQRLPSSATTPQTTPATSGAVIRTPIGMMTPEQAQGMLAAGINFPGVEKQLERYFDPYKELPQQKMQREIETARQKEVIKEGAKRADVPTTAILTQNQQSLQAIDNVIPVLDELITGEGVPGIADFGRGKMQAYLAKTGGIIDQLVGAQNLPKVQGSIDLVTQQIRRGWGETTSDYIKRLQHLKNDLLRRRKMAKDVLETHRIETKTDLSHMSDEELQRIAAGGQ